MSLLPNFRFGDAVMSSEVRLPFGLVAARGVSIDAMGLDDEAQKVAALDWIRTSPPAVEDAIGAFRSFFSVQGFSCPLPDQLRNVRRKGFAKISPFVDALLVCETSTGVLMGVQDLDSIEGGLVYDFAQAEESFEGLRACE